MTQIKMPAGKAGKVEAIIQSIAPTQKLYLSIDNSRYMKMNNGWCLHSTRELRRKLAREAKKAGANHG